MSFESFQILMVIGIVLGNVLSVVVPYLRKIAEGKITTFDIKYLYHAVVSVFWQSLVSVPLWMDWEAPTGLSWILAFVLAVAFGFGGKDFQEQVLKYIRRAEAATAVPSMP